MKRLLTLVGVVVLIVAATFVAGWTWDHATTTTALGFFDGN